MVFIEVDNFFLCFLFVMFFFFWMEGFIFVIFLYILVGDDFFDIVSWYDYFG